MASSRKDPWKRALVERSWTSMDRVRLEWEAKARLHASEGVGEDPRAVLDEAGRELQGWRELAWELLDACETSDAVRCRMKLMEAARWRLGMEPRMPMRPMG